MKIDSLNTITLFFILSVINSSCSILKNEDPEKNVRLFLSEFQSSLSKPDQDILPYFHVPQSREAVLTFINILQNKDPFIVCEVAMPNARISFDKEQIEVEIPVIFRVKELNSKDVESHSLHLGLTRKENTYSITKLEGEEFYQVFQKIKNYNQWEANQKLALKERAWIYETARKLQANYDSVIWYANYDHKNYFYVVDGNWVNYFLQNRTSDEKNENVKMGLISEDGEVIIPLEYDLIGTLGFEESNLVEVRKQDKVGYYNIEAKQLIVEPIYEFIIPYGWENAWAIVKQDSLHGWLDKQYQYHEGFVSARMENWFNKFEYLKQPVQLKPERYVFCEIPKPEQAGNGIIIPPSYLSSNGIFDLIEAGISTTETPIHGWTEYKETTGSFIESITDKLYAVVVTMRERYLEGREEFYEYNQLMFVDENQKHLGSSSLSGTEASLQLVDSTLLEVRTPHDYWFMEEDASVERNLYRHDYFSITPNREIIQLKSSRLYPQTEFVKLDSSYLTGSFIVYNNKTEQDETTHFLSAKTITFMRDEILGDNGYTFPEVQDEYFHHYNYLREKDEPTVPTRDEAIARMGPLDRQNYEFLTKVLSLMQSSI